MISTSDQKIRQQGPPKTLDNTMRVVFLQCPRKFYWQQIRQVDYQIRPSYFSWGSAWHLIKAWWYSSEGCKAEALSPQWKEDATVALAIGLNFWDNSGSPENGFDTRQNLIDCWKAYLKAYPNEQWSLVKGGAEIGWRWPLPTKGGRSSAYFLGGSLDGYISWKGLGHLVLEEKTTRMWLSDFYILQWTFSSQITGYIWYTTHLLGTEATYGALINMMTKKDHKGGKTPKFTYKLETKSEDDLREFERDWRLDIEKIEMSWDRWHWPKTVDTINCTGGEGKKACPYKGFCLSGLDPDMINPLSFPNLIIRKEKWEPWKRTSVERKRNTLKMLPSWGKRGLEASRKSFKSDLQEKLQYLRNKS